MLVACAVCVNEDLAAGQPRVGHGPSNDETTRGIDVELGVPVHQVVRHDFPNDPVMKVTAKRFIAHFRVVLGGQRDAVDAANLAVLVFDGYLGFSIGPEIRQRTVLADLGQPLCESV